jgi:hypothetical protein
VRRFPWQWLVPLAVALPWAIVDSGPASFQADLPYFLRAGETLLSHHWRGTFADPALQAGPLQLLLFGLAGRVSSFVGVAPSRLLAPFVELGLTALLCLVVDRVAPPGRAARVVAPTVFVLLAGPSSVYLAGHPADALIPLLWVLAGREVRRGRLGRAALLVAAGANFEIWSLLGLPLFLLAPQPRQALRAGAIAVATSAAPFVPFAALGSFQMFAYRWPVRSGSLVSLVLPAGTAFPWTMRLLQGALALTAGAAVARTAGRRDVVVCLVPIAIVLVRLLLDPMSGEGYYGLALALLALLAAPFAVRYVRESRGRRVFDTGLADRSLASDP